MDQDQTIEQYDCPTCHNKMVTRRLAPGKIPAVIPCGVCGHEMVPNFEKPEAEQVPTHEWFRPNRAFRRGAKGEQKEHLKSGGLLLRPCK